MSHAQIIKTAEEDGTIILKSEDGYSIAVVEIPGGLEPEDFFKSTDELSEDEAFDGDHKCPHASPSKFDKFRVGKSDTGTYTDEKEYRIIYGRVSGTNKWEVASNSYPSNIWKREEAKEHCKRCNGIAFAKASDCKEVEVTFQEAKSKGYSLEIKKADKLRGLVYGIVLEPNVVDLQNDIESPEEVEKAAHSYLTNLWLSETPNMIGSEHEYPIEAAIVVESFIAPVDFYFDGSPNDEEHMVSKGSWVICSQIKDKKEFAKVISGEYSGFSMQGFGSRKPL